MKTIAIVGATSGVAKEIARIHAQKGVVFLLVARDRENGEALRADLSARGAEVAIEYLDLTEMRDQEKAARFLSSNKNLSLVYLVHGILPSQEECEQNFLSVRKEFEVNLFSTMFLAEEVAKSFEAHSTLGTIVFFSSVAGDRGRKSNYFYGTAKAAITAYASGLRNRLSAKGIQVLTVKPGFIDTKMTAHLPKNALFASPVKVAQSVVKAVDSQKEVLYVPWFWQIIMMMIVHIPEKIFKRLSL